MRKLSYYDETGWRDILNNQSLQWLCDTLNNLPDHKDALYPKSYYLAETQKDNIQIMLQQSIYNKKCTYWELINSLCDEHREKTYISRNTPLSEHLGLLRGDDFVLAKISQHLVSLKFGHSSLSDNILEPIIISFLIIEKCAAHPATRSTANMYSNRMKSDFDAQIESACQIPIGIKEQMLNLNPTTQQIQLLDNYIPIFKS